jgi:putative addiction module CopG family antidote
MTIQLPDDLKHFIQAEVENGHFASEEEVLAEGLRLLRNQLARKESVLDEPNTSIPDSLLGAMPDSANELDEIVAEVMRNREQQPWRLTPRE